MSKEMRPWAGRQTPEKPVAQFDLQLVWQA